MTADGEPPSRPRVIVHMWATVDGRITLRRGQSERELWTLAAPYGGASLMMEVRDRVSPWRRLWNPQVILSGSGTYRVLPGFQGPSKPLPPFRGNRSLLSEDFIPQDFVTRAKAEGWWAVIDSGGRLRWSYKEHNGWHLLLLVAQRTPPEHLAWLRRQGIPYLVVGEDRVDLHAALRRMGERLAVMTVLAIGGGGLNGALLRAGLVDEVSVVFVPVVAGGEDTPTIFDAPELAPADGPIRLHLVESKVQAGDVLWARYRVTSNER